MHHTERVSPTPGDEKEPDKPSRIIDNHGEEISAGIPIGLTLEDFREVAGSLPELEA